MQKSLSSTCSNTGQLQEKPADVASLDGELKKKNSEWSSGVESRVNFRATLQICSRASSLCLSPCPLTWVKGAFRSTAELFKSCVWVLVWKSGSAEGARGRFTPHDQERWRPFPRQPIFPSLCSPLHLPAQAALAPVQFNFSRAHRLVLSPSDPSVSLPRKKRLSYFLPL